jgi:hypothetical protein
MHITKTFHTVDSVRDVVRETMEVADSQEIEVCVLF